MSLTDAHPMPTPIPDPGPEPKGGVGTEAHAEWLAAYYARRDYIRKARLHLVAAAVDRLANKERAGALTDAETIAMIVGGAYVEARGNIDASPFAGLFG